MEYGETLNWNIVSSIDDPPTLQAGEVHLWWVPLAITAKQLEESLLQLSDKQHEKIRRLPNEEKRQRYMAGRVFLNRLLRLYLRVQSFELTFGKYGKPALKNADLPLRFNFSDTEGYGLFAFSLNIELGVDLESTTRQGRFQQIIDRRFSIREQAVLEGSNTEQFLACWTRKEAYGKAMGVGLNYSLDQHTLCDTLEKTVSTTPDDAWCLQQISIKEEQSGFIACLVSEGEIEKQLKAFRFIEAKP